MTLDRLIKSFEEIPLMKSKYGSNPFDESQLKAIYSYILSP